MQEHTDDITALAVSPCGQWVATGEAGPNPKVRGEIAHAKELGQSLG